MVWENCLNCQFEPNWRGVHGGVFDGDLGEGQCLFSCHSIQSKLPAGTRLDPPMLMRRHNNLFIVEWWTKGRRSFPSSCPAFRPKRKTKNEK